MSTLTKPKYQHDCKACEFLGQVIQEGHTFDLYFCPTGGLIGPTLVYRHGDDGPEYGSTPPNTMVALEQEYPDRMKNHPGLVAYKMAEKRGLLDESETVQ